MKPPTETVRICYGAVWHGVARCAMLGFGNAVSHRPQWHGLVAISATCRTRLFRVVRTHVVRVPRSRNSGSSLLYGENSQMNSQRWVGKCNWKFQWQSTGKVNIYWNMPLKSIGKCHWQSTMISEVSISGMQSLAPSPKDRRQHM